MKHLPEVCLVALSLAVIQPFVNAQSVAEIPLQKGISVDLPVTSNAVAVPEADKENALIVTVTSKGGVYLGVSLTSIAELSERIKPALSHRSEKTLYIKADARAPYASIVRILDSVRTSGIQQLTLLTAQLDQQDASRPVPPKGFEMRIASGR